MDLRVKKTKTSIINVFIALRAQKPLEKITVKELCEKANINKSTFYTHYSDIYNLADIVETEVVNSILESLSHPEYVVDKPEEFVKELFLAYHAQGALLQTLFSGNRSSNLITKIESELKALICKIYPEFKNDLIKNVILSYQVYGGYYAFRENSHYDAEKIVNIISKLTKETHVLYTD